MHEVDNLCRHADVHVAMYMSPQSAGTHIHLVCSNANTLVGVQASRGKREMEQAGVRTE